MDTLRRCITAAGVVGVLSVVAGCATLDPKQAVTEKVEQVKKGPEAAPFRTITGFSGALRCMDNLFVSHGIRDVSVLLEDIVDNTKKVNAGTKDMLTSAVSDMTRRSRAIRLIHYGQDTANLIGFLQQAQQGQPYQMLPLYDIKGSISQLDESVARKQNEIGAGVGNIVNLGYANSASANILGLDLTMLSTADMSLLSGVNSRNSVVIFKQGSGFDGDAQIKKFGINFSMALTASEGQSQALRTLVELAAIELFGRLTKVPYWTCLGVSPQDEAVKSEIADWFATLYGEPSELVGYFQHHLRLRGYYDGPVDGELTIELRDAVSDFREALGMSRDPKINEEVFAAYLSSNLAELQAKSAVYVEKRRLAAQAVPLTVAIVSAKSGKTFDPGELVEVTVQAGRDAYVYCYMQDEERKIQRFFPNRFVRDPRVAANAPIVLPGKLPFQIYANDRKVTETMACFATERDVLPDLPPAIRAVDFEPVSVASLDELRSAFEGAANGSVVEDRLEIRFQ